MKANDRDRLTASLSDHVAKIAADLRPKMRGPGSARVAAEQLHKDERVSEDFEVWTDLLSRRAAVLWVLKSVYVRVLEDRGLLAPGRLLDLEAQQLFEKLAPNLGETAFLRWIYRDLASTRGGVPELFSPQPAEVALPSDDLSRALIAFWRYRDADTGAVWSFAEERFEGELMGDLYQDLDPVVKDRFALCQTPDFVRAFILDRTLTPAIEAFGADEVRLLDPACGSGHFLIDGLKRLVAATAEKHSDWSHEKVVTHALDRVVGIDLNDYACALARTRLIMTAAELAGVAKLADAARFHPHVYWADGLEQVERDEQKPSLQYALFEKVEEKPRATLTRSDVRMALRKVFATKFHAVVANPPYDIERDASRKAYHRETVGRQKRYVSAYKQYHLSSPFIERCFQLATPDAFVGFITDNQFMKRDYGKPLIEKVLARLDLTLLVDTSRAQLFGTPTAILIARNRPRRAPDVHAVLSRRAESNAPVDGESEMWRSFNAASTNVSFENDFVFVRQLDRKELSSHAWALGEEESASLVDRINKLPHVKLGTVALEMGRTTACGHDPVFVLTAHAARRLSADRCSLPFVDGASVRDWAVDDSLVAVYPYAELGGVPFGQDDERLPPYLWRYRSLLASRTMFNKTVEQHGKRWFEHLEHYEARVRETTKLVFSNIATHNHFALLERAALFNSKAPVIVVTRDWESRRSAILGILSSSLACYWMKDRFHPLGSTSANRNHPDPERAAYEFSVTGLKSFPLPEACLRDERVLHLGEELTDLARQRREVLRPEFWKTSCDSADALRARLAERWTKHDEIRQRQVFAQEQLDWLVYQLCGLTSRDLTCPKEGGVRRLPRGQRAFERVRGRRSFVRQRGALLPPELAECETGSSDLPVEYAPVTSAREREIQTNPAVAEIEQYLYKRLWRDTEDNVAEPAFRQRMDSEQLSSALTEMVETAISARAFACTAHRLTTDLMDRRAFQVVAEVVAGSAAYDALSLVYRALALGAVPDHPAHIYTDSGLEKRKLWDGIWQRQYAAPETSLEMKGADFPVYSQGSRGKSTDFVATDYWKLRGPFDVPSERFIGFTDVPGRAGVETLYGWAGWTAQQRVKAILAIDEELEDASVPLADRIGLLDSAWRLLLDVAREHAAAASRLKAELQALVGPDGPSRELIEDWKKRFPPPTARASRARKTAAARDDAQDRETEERDES